VGEAQTTCYSDTVSNPPVPRRRFVIFLPHRVLNTFKSMIADDDVLERDDLYILDQMQDFISTKDVFCFAAAKQLMTWIERAVSSFCGDYSLQSFV
jgi:hypothetical protein